MPFIRSAYNYDRDAASVESGLACKGERRAKQEFKDECDINVLLRRFNITGQLPVGVRMPTYGDFDVVNDFHSAANSIAMAREAFDMMPADVRRRFNNDPGDFVDFCSDSKNRDEAVKLGLVPPAVKEAPAKQDPPKATGGSAPSPGSSSSPEGVAAAPAAAVGTLST